MSTQLATAGAQPRALLPFTPRPRDAEDVPLGTPVETPLGRRAVVVGYRGKRRGHRVWLVCRYLQPENRRHAIVQLLPELVRIIGKEEGA